MQKKQTFDRIKVKLFVFLVGNFSSNPPTESNKLITNVKANNFSKHGKF